MKEQIKNSGSFAGFSGNQLKMFAIIAMAADHLAWTLCPGYAHKEGWILLIHFCGRLAAPVMWFMISENICRDYLCLPSFRILHTIFVLEFRSYRFKILY